MRQFDYTKKWKKMLTSEIVRYLTTIHEYKGGTALNCGTPCGCIRKSC